MNLQDTDLRRWASEGLSFLTMDADVKEKLVEDEVSYPILFLGMYRIFGLFYVMYPAGYQIKYPTCIPPDTYLVSLRISAKNLEENEVHHPT